MMPQKGHFGLGRAYQKLQVLGDKQGGLIWVVRYYWQKFLQLHAVYGVVFVKLLCLPLQDSLIPLMSNNNLICYHNQCFL